MPFASRFPLLFQLETNKACTVSSCLVMYEDEICGTWNWKRQPSLRAKIEEIRELLLECQQVRLSHGNDRWCWILDESNEFSVKGVKEKMLMDTGSVAGYNFKWNKWVPLKVEVLPWRAEMERIPSLVSLAKRNVEVSSVLYPMCGETEESAEHFFRDLLEMFKFTRFPKRKAKAFHAVCLTTIWCLWEARNEAVFNGNIAQLNNVVGGIKVLGFLWVRNRSKLDAITWENWRSFNL
ncbi:uncharacterized protein LOC143608265 [Bidens hawaiensis]|uniref:uncharacterized protein LOC143608265 n=1 Tax=Bidens hawaiensis TaxID=980011 RepID=UPI00404B3FA3